MWKIITLTADIAFLVVLHIKLYTDRAHMPHGKMHISKHSPLDRLNSVGKRYLYHFLLVSVILNTAAAILLLSGVKHLILSILWIIGTAASVLIFILILTKAKKIRPKY